MFSIKRNDVDNESTKSNAKNEPVTQNSTVFDAVKLTIWNLFDSISAFASYNTAHWVLFVDRWKNNLTSINTTTYKRGEIVFLDLGAQNYRYEPSYMRKMISMVKVAIILGVISTIVLKQSKASLLNGMT